MQSLEAKHMQIPFEKIIQNTDILLVLIDLNGKLYYINDIGQRITGFAQDELIGKQICDLLYHKAEIPHFRNAFKDSIDGKPTLIRNHWIDKNNQPHLIEWSGKPIKDENGKIAYILGTGREIQDERSRNRKHYEDFIRTELVLDFLQEGLWEWNVISNDFYISPSIEKILKFEIGTFPKTVQAWEERVHPEDFDKSFAKLESHLNGETEVFQAIYRVKTKEDEWIWILDTGKVVERDENNNPVLMVGTNSVISNFVKAQEENRKLTLAVEQSPTSIVITDKDGNIEYVNPKFTETTGYTFEEVLGRNPNILKSGKQKENFYQKLWNTLNSGKVWHGEFHNKAKNGTLFWEDAIITPLLDANKEITHFVAVKQDITERKKLQEQLVQSQKMEAIGTLAGGVAHDFNNLLTVISGYSEILLFQLKDNEKALKGVTEIKKASDRAASLTRQLLAFSRKQILKPKTVDLNEIVKNLSKMLRRLIGEDIQLEINLDENLKFINADAGQLEQILMNLVVNARDAMPNGGKVEVLTYCGVLPEKGLNFMQNSSPQEIFSILSVKDNGMGISKKNMKHILDPFFTTKSAGKGTGLGLSVVYGIVKQHSGWINVESEEGKGANFEIYFPLSKDNIQNELNIQTNLKLLKGSGQKILLVEDEPSVRAVAEKTLLDSNYRIYPVGTAEEAVNIFNEHNGDFDLIFSDVVLPDRSGLQLVSEFLDTNPNLKILVASGYTDERSQWSKFQERGIHYLQKPYQLKELLVCVKDILNENS
ncbi:MAG: PAS domain S-box protein [Calditrichaeota bacterium]|nr:MAG: PAS domain S-box protein [Calditrichota bacterium]